MTEMMYKTEKPVSDTWECIRKKFAEEKVPYPRVLNLELTTRCNLQCIMCPKTLGKKEDFQDGDMDDTVFRMVENEVLPHVRQVVLSFVGEPLLRKNYLYRLMDICYERRIAVSLVTNGLLLDRETAEFLVDKKLLELNVSIDAPYPDMYKQIRGGNFEKLIGNLEYLKHVKNNRGVVEPHMKLSFVAMKRNISGLTKFVELAASLEAREIVIQSLHVQKGIEHEEITMSKEKEYFNYLETARIAGQKLGVNLSISPDLTVPDKQFSVYKADSDDFVCRLPWTTLYIDRFGKIRPCCGLPPLGNLNKNNLEEIWFGSGFQRFRQKLVLEDSGYCQNCSECSSRNNPMASHSLNLRTPHQLGNGWYHHEKENRQDYRWTGEKASFYLKPNSSNTLLLEYSGLNNNGKSKYSRLSVEHKLVGILDHSREMTEVSIDFHDQEALRFDLETAHPAIPWNLDKNYPDPRVLGLRIGFAGIINPNNFENKIKILHVEIPSNPVNHNKEFQVRVYWKKLAESEINPVLFLHFIHESADFARHMIGPLSRYLSWFKTRFFQMDRILCPESEKDNDITKNVFDIDVNHMQKSGLYNVYMGCWNPSETKKRFKTVDRNPRTYVKINRLEIV